MTLSKQDDRPIGIFDSGVGGLSVLGKLAAAFPNENFIYLGDTARLPYGSKSAKTIRNYSEQILRFLSQKNVKAFVVACNTASSQISEHHWNNLPLYTVIEPGALTAHKKSSNRKIGVIGTKAAINSAAYTKALLKLDPAVKIFSQSCPLLVPLAEEGLDLDPLTDQFIERYLKKLLAEKIDTLILGCTHYPLLMGSLRRICGDKINLIESGDALAEQMKIDLNSQKWLPRADAKGKTVLLSTDYSPLFDQIAQSTLTHYTSVEIVDLQTFAGAGS